MRTGRPLGSSRRGRSSHRRCSRASSTSAEALCQVGRGLYRRWAVLDDLLVAVRRFWGILGGFLLALECTQEAVEISDAFPKPRERDLYVVKFRLELGDTLRPRLGSAFEGPHVQTIARLTVKTQPSTFALPAGGGSQGEGSYGEQVPAGGDLVVLSL